MKIKIAILENDENYLNRIVAVFSTKYADKFQIYSFTNIELALKSIEDDKIDVLVASDVFEIDTSKLPNRCSFAYFVNSLDIETLRNERAICKFQKAELIYKQILSIYSENEGSLAGFRLADDKCRTIVFSSPCGGVGTSTIAATFAVYLAKRNKKVVYVNLDNFGSSEIFFSGMGQFDMSDVIFAIKSKKANLALKLESYVKCDNRGVYYFAPTKFALDMLEFTHEERMQLLNELKLTGSYDYMIVDMVFGLDKNSLDYYKNAQNIVMVSDGSKISNAKILSAYEAVTTIDHNQDIVISKKFSLLYNRFSSKIGKSLEENDLINIGGFPIYAQATTEQIMNQLADSNVFEKIV